MIGERIKAARLKKQLTQKALGGLVGVSGASVSQWENGQTKDLKLCTLFKVADALGIDPRQLATGKPGREEPMAPDVQRLIEAYEAADEEYRPIIMMVVCAPPTLRREIARSMVTAMVRSNLSPPLLPSPKDIQ